MRFLFAGLVAILGCSGPTQKSENGQDTPVGSVDLEMLSDSSVQQRIMASWVIRFADQKIRQDKEFDEKDGKIPDKAKGYGKLYRGEHVEAIPYLSGESLARLHLKYSSIYRQGVAIHSYATAHIYADPVQAKNSAEQEKVRYLGLRGKEDSKETLYLRGVAFSFLNELEQAKKDLQMFTNAADPVLKDRATQWLIWLNGDRSTSPQLFGFFFGPL